MLALIDAAERGMMPFARLVADDRAIIEPAGGRLLVRPHGAIAGLIEIRGIGIRRMVHEPLAVVGWVVDLGAEDAERMPAEGAAITLKGVRLPRLAVPSGVAPLPMLLAVIGRTGVER